MRTKPKWRWVCTKSITPMVTGDMAVMVMVMVGTEVITLMETLTTNLTMPTPTDTMTMVTINHLNTTGLLSSTTKTITGNRVLLANKMHIHTAAVTRGLVTVETTLMAITEDMVEGMVVMEAAMVDTVIRKKKMTQKKTGGTT